MSTNQIRLVTEQTSDTSLIKSFTIVSSDKSPIETSSSCSATQFIQSDSSQEKPRETGQPLIKDTISTSFYTDIYGMTRATTVKYSTIQADAIESIRSGNSRGVTISTRTTITDKETVSTFTHTVSVGETDQATKNNGINRENEQSTVRSSGIFQASSATAQLHLGGVSMFTSVDIQQSLNAASIYTVWFLLCAVPLTFPIFFI